MQVRWTAPAAKDLQEIVRFIQKDNPTAARTVAKALFDAANAVDLFPMKGRSGRIAGTRELAIPGLSYIVVYQLSSATIHILHIYHGARNWQVE
jgi:addiction module RelE/StbE family toxin